MIHGLTIRAYRGEEAQPFLADLAQLRLQIFREYPYLYEGDLAYETEYATSYRNCPDSILVVAQDQGKVIGISTAFPLVSAMSKKMELNKAFADHPHPMSDYFYFGESVLLPQYRGSGIYKEFFRYREAAALRHGCNRSLFMAIDRPATHPAAPEGYESLEPMWHRFNYQKEPKLVANYLWKEVGATEETEHTMVGWSKTLQAP